MQYSWRFLRLVYAQWSSLVTGSFSAVLVVFGLGFSIATALGANVPGSAIIQIGTWILAGLSGGRAAFVVWKREYLAKETAEKELGKFIDEFAHSLHLDSISFEENREIDHATKQLKNRDGQFVLKFNNTISRPVSYHIERIEIDGREQTTFGTRGAVLSSLSPAAFYCERRPIDVPLDVTFNSTIEFQITYGHPTHHTRRMLKNATVECNPMGQRTRFLFQRDEDSPIG